MELQKGTFNTIAKARVRVGGNFPVWARVNKNKLAGGWIDHTKYNAGDVIPAGTMVHYEGPGKEVTVITADSVEGAAEVVRLMVSAAVTDGNITVTLNGTDTTVAVTEGMTAKEVAAAITETSFTGYTAEQDGIAVTFTAEEAGAKESCAFDGGDTGVEGAIEVLVTGVDAGDGNYDDVNGLIFNDVCIPDGCTLATCAVVTDGRIYADRVASGPLPTEIESKLTAIEFIRES